jgi:metal-sulfur cluster biosynthetic enzyme
MSDAIIDALGSIHDPCCRERGISIVDMGLVRSAEVDGSTARVELLLTSGWCPFASRILQDVDETVRSIPGIDHSSVEIVWDEPWTMERLSDEARSKLVFLPAPGLVADRGLYVHEMSAKPARAGGEAT